MQFHRFVQDRPEHRQIDLLGDLLLGPEPFNTAETEFEGTFDIGIERRRRKSTSPAVQECMQPFRHLASFGHCERVLRGEAYAERHLSPHHIVRRLVIQLIDIAARFAGVLVVAAGTVSDVYDRSALQQPVKVIGINSFMVHRRRQPVGKPQVMRDKRRPGGQIARERIVVGRKDQHILEIEVTGFEYPHHLYSAERFPFVGDADALQDFSQQR